MAKLEFQIGDWVEVFGVVRFRYRKVAKNGKIDGIRKKVSRVTKTGRMDSIGKKVSRVHVRKQLNASFKGRVVGATYRCEGIIDPGSGFWSEYGYDVEQSTFTTIEKVLVYKVVRGMINVPVDVLEEDMIRILGSRSSDLPFLYKRTLYKPARVIRNRWVKHD